jgi:hypothetical protein
MKLAHDVSISADPWITDCVGVAGLLAEVKRLLKKSVVLIAA